MVSYSVDDLGINDNCIKGQQVWNELAYGFAAEKDRKLSLLIKGYSLLPKRHCEAVFIDFLMETVPDLIENIERAAQNGFCLLL